MNSGEANAMCLKDRSQKLTDAHTCTCRCARINMSQVKQPIAAVDDSDMELLLCRPAEDRLSDRGEIGRRLNTGSPCRPPSGEIARSAHGADDKFSGVARYASTQQPVGDVALDEPLWPLSECN
jgi:hypothetical protein